jgi:thiol-disulfide isomerase/thioredoxin
LNIQLFKQVLIMRFVSQILAASLCTIAFIAPSYATTSGELAPAFNLSALQNSSAAQIQLSDYKGKVVYVDFWASWCGPCKRSFPVLNSLRSKYQSQGFEVIGVNLDDDVADAKAFLAKLPVSFPIALDNKGATAEQYAVKGMPSAYLIDKQGKVQYVIEGFSDNEAAQLDAHISQLLGQ